MTIGATLLFTRDGNDGPSDPQSAGDSSDIASADDTGPIAIITDEPTCDRFMGINNSLADLQKQGWGDQRASLGPASEWSADQRALVEPVASAMRNAADQFVSLARETPHRLMRELYAQSIAYGRAYADSIPTYKPDDDELAAANINAVSALMGICETITNGAANRSLGVPAAAPPTRVPSLGDLSDPQRFLSTPGGVCAQFEQLSNQFNKDTAEWQTVDGDLPMKQWTPEQRIAYQEALPFMSTWASALDEAGRESGNPVMEDFSVAAAAYLRAFVTVKDSYTPADSWLTYVAFRFNQLIIKACAAEG